MLLWPTSLLLVPLSWDRSTFLFERHFAMRFRYHICIVSIAIRVSFHLLASQPALSRPLMPAFLTQGSSKYIVALGGIPGSGKSSVAARVAELVNFRAPGACVVMPMDGFHLYRKQLDQLPVLSPTVYKELFAVEFRTGPGRGT